MLQTHLMVRTLSALGLAALLAACSGSGSSGTITPSGVAPDSQARPPTVPNHTATDSVTTIVANYGSNNLSVYTVNPKSGALAPVAGSPFGAGTGPFDTIIERTQDAIFAYATNAGSNNVSAYTVNAKSGALTPVAGSPFGAGSGPAGLRARITPILAGTDFLQVGNNGSNSISAYTINANSGALKQVAGSPFGAGTGPIDVEIIERTQDAIFAYVTNTGSNNVSAYAVNAKSGALKQVKGSPFGAGTRPAGVAEVENGGTTYLYVANAGSNNVSAYTVNAKSGALTPVKGSPFAAGTNPAAVADVETNGTSYLYVTNSGSNNVSAYSINTTSGALTQVSGSPFAAGSGPIGVAACSVTQKGRSDNYAYVTNRSSNNVSAYSVDATSGALTQVKGSPFSAGTAPYGVACDGVPGS